MTDKQIKCLIARIPHIVLIIIAIISAIAGKFAFCLGTVIGWGLCAVAWELWSKFTSKDRQVIKIKTPRKRG